MNSLKVSPLFFEELEYYGLSADGAETLACKEGIITARVRKGAGTAILKCFEKQELRRELTNYEILQSLGVRPLRCWAEAGARSFWRISGIRAACGPVGKAIFPIQR